MSNVSVTFVLATFDLATIVHNSNISAVTAPTQKKVLGLKNIGSQKMLGPKKLMGTKICGSKKILDPKFIWVQKNLG